MKKTTYKMSALTIDNIPYMIQLILDRQKIEIKHFSFLKDTKIEIKKLEEYYIDLFEKKQVIGVGAYEDNILKGFILGILTKSKYKNYILVPYTCIAVVKDNPNDLLYHMYAFVSKAWVQEKFFQHEIYIPLGDQSYQEAFFNLCFFMEQTYAILQISDFKDFNDHANINIRLATSNDGHIMRSMADLVYRHQSASPVFIPAFPEMVNLIRDGYEKSVIDEDSVILIAEKNNEVLGFHLYERSDSSISIPKNCIELEVGATKESQRGSGVATALIHHGLKMMKEKGYKYINTDWRISNLAAQSFWMKCQFRPYMTRFVRIISPLYEHANFDVLDHSL